MTDKPHLDEKIEDEDISPSGSGLPPAHDNEHWAAMFRGTVLASQKQGLITYVNIADQKAQVMLFINSLIIPFILPGVEMPDYRLAAIIALITAALSVFFAVMTVFPRGPARFKKRPYSNQLHFADIKQHPTFASYLHDVRPIYNDLGKLGTESLKYMYDMSRFVLKGKYFWLRLCYGGFLIGNILALAVFLYSIAT